MSVCDVEVCGLCVGCVVCVVWSCVGYVCGVELCGVYVACVLWKSVVEVCVVYVWCSDDKCVWCGGVCGVEMSVVWRCVWYGGVCGVEVCVVWRCVWYRREWCICGAVMMDLCGVCRRQRGVPQRSSLRLCCK